jgi:hypothetical protein
MRPYSDLDVHAQSSKSHFFTAFLQGKFSETNLLLSPAAGDLQ